jgi:hypothetical protein
MQPEPDRCGVCIVRVVRQTTGLMITLIERPDVNDASTQTQCTLADVAQALDAIRNFVLDAAR